MKTKTIGILLAIVGIIMIAYTGFNYITTEKVVDIGPIHIDKEKNHEIQWNPIVGAILLAAGCVVIITNRNSSN